MRQGGKTGKEDRKKGRNGGANNWKDLDVYNIQDSRWGNGTRFTYFFAIVVFWIGIGDIHLAWCRQCS